MWDMLWPMLIVIGANTIYNICTKSLPEHTSMYASFFVTYLLATVCSALLFFFTAGQKSLFAEVAKTNWTAIALGLSIITIEVGYVYMYRAGWKVSTASLIANTALACALLVVGILLYKEEVSVQQLIGMGICAVGLYLIGR